MMIFLVLSVFFEGLFRTLERVGTDRTAFILVKKKQAEACFFNSLVTLLACPNHLNGVGSRCSPALKACGWAA